MKALQIGCQSQIRKKKNFMNTKQDLKVLPRSSFWQLIWIVNILYNF